MTETITQKAKRLAAIAAVATFNKSTPQGQWINWTALQMVGKDASPADIAPDELGCAETVCDVILAAGFPMPVIISTTALYDHLKNSPVWYQVTKPVAGDIIISPTGMGGENGITNGHTGIVGELGVVMSNTSATGNFMKNYTLDTWKQRYQIKGGYPVYYFRRIA